MNNFEENFKKNRQGYYATADFSNNSGDDGVAVKVFGAAWTVPSAPISPNSTALLDLMIALRSNTNGSVLASTLTWYPDAQAWFASCVYTEGELDFTSRDRIKVEPGDRLEARIAFIKRRDMYSYIAYFLGDKFKSAAHTVKTPNSLNITSVLFDAQTYDYVDLPPDESVRVKNIFVELPMTGGIPNPTTKANWEFDSGGVHTPSGRGGVVVDDSILAGEIDFYFR